MNHVSMFLFIRSIQYSLDCIHVSMYRRLIYVAFTSVRAVFWEIFYLSENQLCHNSSYVTELNYVQTNTFVRMKTGL